MLQKSKDNDWSVPSRQNLSDGYPYVVSLKGGEKRYLHSTVDLPTIQALHKEAIEKGAPFLDFDGARWATGDAREGPDCAGYVLVSEIVAIGYPDPATMSMIMGAAFTEGPAEAPEVEDEHAGHNHEAAPAPAQPPAAMKFLQS